MVKPLLISCLISWWLGWTLAWIGVYIWVKWDNGRLKYIDKGKLEVKK